MPNLNVIHLMGNLTRNPELRVTPKGTAITQFSMAVNRKWKSESGQESEEVLFIDCEAWGKTGETIAKYCTKGKPLFVAGRLKQDTWEDKVTKDKRSKIKVVVETFQFLGLADSGRGPAREQTTSVGANPKPAAQQDA